MTSQDSRDKKDFFISYTGRDGDFARWIAWQLEEAGYTTVFQEWDFRPGNNFILQMDQATQQAERTLIVLSHNFLESDFAAAEWAAAFARDPRGEKGTLLPVRIDDINPSGLLRAIVYIDLFGITDEGQMRKRLLDGVKRGRRKPRTAPPMPMPRWQKQRIEQLERHIAADQKLLAQYEAQSQVETNPRRLLGIEREIEREKQTLTEWFKEYNELTSTGASDSVQLLGELAALRRQFGTLQTQILGMHENLSGEIAGVGEQVSRYHNVILQRIDRLSVAQREDVDGLLTLVQQAQFSRDQGDEIVALVQEVLAQGQTLPDAAYWHELQQAVNEQDSLQGKLKIAIPLLPLLEYEIELASDLLPDIKDVWARLRRRLGK